MNNYKVGKITLVVFTLLAIFSMISLSFFSDWQVIYHSTVDPHPEVDHAASTNKAIIWGFSFYSFGSWFGLFLPLLQTSQVPLDSKPSS